MAQSEALVLLNPAAGFGERRLDAERLRSALEGAGLPSEWMETTPEVDADAIIRQAGGDGTVVVIGGDGTVQAAARELRGGDRPLAIVPVGTGNVVALRLDIPLQLGAALSVAHSGKARRVDLGMCDDQPFLLTAGMGIDGQLVREADRRLKSKLGKSAYLLSVARNLPVRHHDFEIEVDGKTVFERAAAVSVANFGTQMGPWIFPPDANGVDGQLEVVAIRAETFDQVVSLLAAPFRLLPRTHRGLGLYRGRRIRVRSETALPLQLDGEDMGDHQGFVASVDPGALPILLPARKPFFRWPVPSSV